jgi:Flp pilus assembly protein TadG
MRRSMNAWHRLKLRFRDDTSERGSAALVEFAMVALVLFPLILGVYDFSLAVYSYSFISNAAREATRYASVRGSTFTSYGNCANAPPVHYQCVAQGGSTNDIAAYVDYLVPAGVYFNQSASAGTPGYLGVTTTWNPPNAPKSCAAPTNQPGCFVQVQVQYTYGFKTAYLWPKLGAITLTSTSEMMVEQ